MGACRARCAVRGRRAGRGRPAWRAALLRAVRLLRQEDGGTGEDPAAERAPLAPDLLVPLGPLRLDQVGEHEPGGDQLADPVTERAVVLDVGGRAGPVVLDVGPPVEVGVYGDEAALA